MTDPQKTTATRVWGICKDVAENIWQLKPSDEYAYAVAQLLFGTAAHESDGFRARRQYGFSATSTGGAFSLWQMERASIENGLIQIKQSTALADKVALMTRWDGRVDFAFASQAIQREDGDLFACILARLHYLRCPGAIPLSVYGQANYWKKYFNSYLGAGTPQQYMIHWERYCKDIVEGDAG